MPSLTVLGVVALALAPVSEPVRDPTTRQPTEDRPAESTEPGSRFRAAVLAVEGVEYDALRAEIALRLPDLHLERHEKGVQPNERPFLFVHVAGMPDQQGPYRLTLIASDGRAYFRTIEAQPPDSERVVAATIANLVFSIEAGAVEPDEEGITIPGPEASETAEPAAKAPPASDSRPLDPTRPTWELGPVVGPGIVLALGPPRYADVFAAWGAHAGLDARAPNGLLLAFDLRAAGRSARGYRLTRVRIGLGVGYDLRIAAFELGTAALFDVEPWLVSRGGSRVPVEREDGGRVDRRPLLGGRLRISPGYRIPIDRGPLRSVRVGPRLELGGAFIVDSGANVPGIAADEAAERPQLFRVGGLELAAAIEVALWFDPMRRK